MRKRLTLTYYMPNLTEMMNEIDELIYQYNKRMAIEHLNFVPEGVSPERVGKYPSGTR